MKKFTLGFIIILVFAAAIYWIGLTQRRVEPDTFGVLYTKTNGIIDKPVLPGEKNWNWQFLFPTNTKLKLFSITPHVATYTVSGELPSGQFYSDLYKSKDIFNYDFTFNIAVTIAPESVVELIKLNQVTDNDSLKEYLDCAGKTIAQFSTSYILEKAKSNSEFTVETLKKDEILKNIKIYNDFPSVEVYSLSIEKSKLPNYKLYDYLQENYPKIINQNNIKESEND